MNEPIPELTVEKPNLTNTMNWTRAIVMCLAIPFLLFNVVTAEYAVLPHHGVQERLRCRTRTSVPIPIPIPIPVPASVSSPPPSKLRHFQRR